MLKQSISILITIISFASFGGSIKYNLSMPKPQNHYFHVEMELDGFKEKELNVKMPIWAPGSYLAREFAKNVNLVKAFDANGNALEVKKTNKNTWCIKKGKAKSIKVNYEVYAFELTVRTSFLDQTHGFVSGSGVFMYVDGHKDQDGLVEVLPYKGFSNITTALPLESGESVQADGAGTYSFENYDHLVDCPIEIGNQEIFTFKAGGTKHTVAMYGTGNYDVELLQIDMAKVVESATEVFGQNPNKEYTFIIHNVVDGQGGLEHTNSTVLSVNRWTYEGSKYVGFLSLVAHEYFHLWNVKRIRPIELGPFDYDSEVYTSMLWVMEGFTSYYDELLLLRAGFYTKEQFLAKLFGTINYVEGTPGTRVQPVAHASFDAWIKAYRPNENSSNTTMSYYSKGTVIATMIDAMIIESSNGEKCLDHFMQHLYRVFYQGKGRGFTEKEFKTELESFVNKDLTEFYDKYIDGTEIPDYTQVFDVFDLKVAYKGEPKPSVGLALKESGGKTIIRGIRSGSSAENAGLSVNDEIVGVNGFRASKKSLEDYFKTVSKGDVIEILFSRDQQLYATEVVVANYEKPKFDYKIDSATKANDKYKYWLRGE